VLLPITQYYIRELRPRLCGFLTKVIYSGKNIRFGKNLRADSIPVIIIDKKSDLSIGSNLQLGRDVEIRVHGSSKIIIADNVKLDRGIRILSANNSTINIGYRTKIGLYTVLNGGDSITIGEKVLISGFVYLQTSMHGFKNKNLNVQDQGYLHSPIQLYNDVWLGTHVVIMPGCILEKGVVVGSNGVVNKNVAEYTIVAGIPAKPIKTRD